MGISFAHLGVAFVCFVAMPRIVAAEGSIQDEVVAHAFIPSDDNVHGETRLCRRSDGACVQTILHSASFRRGIREIQLREADVWSRPRPGVEDSLRYREELEKAKQAVVQSASPDAPAGQPYTMVMEFTYRPGDSRISFFHASVERTNDTFRLISKNEISSIQVSDAYMSRAMLVMSAAAFSQHRSDTVSLLQSCGWEDLSATADPASPLPVR